jgi:hypothetical protein
MAEVDLGPDELDRLEDALEVLELDGALERWTEDELGPRVYARLVDYRDVLAATREALPLEDVPAGVLDGVLAQAQQAATAPAVAARAAEASWWSRARRSFMVPVLALAGTAALVLWVLDPKDQAEVVDPPAAAEAPARAQAVRADQAEQKAAPTPSAAPVEAAAVPDEAEPSLAPIDAPEGAVTTVEAEARKDADHQAPAKPTEVDAGRSKNTLGSAYGGLPGGSGGALPGPAQPQKKSGGSTAPASGTSGRWDLVARGDRARQAGDCVAARDEYALALEDDEPQVRARAFAGLGLCDAAVGDEASADANYERARALDDGIGRFIESQSERSRSEKKSPKPTRKSKAVLDEAMDPFD